MDLSRHILSLLIFLIGKRAADGLSKLVPNRRQAVSVSLTLTCQDDGPITEQVNFFKTSVIQGGCSPNCGSGETGYLVSQNTTASETYLTISSLEELRDCGDWTCRQGSAADSLPLNIGCPIPCRIDPITDITVTPPISSLTSADNISVEVSVPCCSQTATITWKYQNGASVPLNSITTTPSTSCSAGEKQTVNTFQPQRNDFPRSGSVNLTLTIEHDSFDPPDYTVVFTTPIDLGGAETTTSSSSSTSSPSPTTSPSTSTSTSSSSSPSTATTGTSQHTTLSIVYITLIAVLTPVLILITAVIFVVVRSRKKN